MRVRVAAVVFVALAGAFGVRVAAPPAAGPATALTITFWSHAGTAPPHARATLTCAPPGGTLAKQARACARLAAAGGAKALAPLPADAVCTEIAGGPSHAVVSGWVDGRRVWAHLQQRNGCEISRWQALAFLLPTG